MVASTRLLLTFLGVTLLAATLSNASVLVNTQIWVSNSGNDTTGQGTFEAPFQTTERAFQAHPDNIALMLEEGVYNVSIPAAASNIAVIGQPKATLNWFSWQQIGVTTPLTIYVANLEVLHENSALLPLFQLNGQLKNATLSNVNITGSVPVVTEPLATFITGPVDASTLTFNKVNMKNQGVALTNVEISGFHTLSVSGWEVLGQFGIVSVKQVAYVTIRGLMLGFGPNRPSSAGELAISKAQFVSISHSNLFQATLQLFNNVAATISDSNVFLSLLKIGNMPTEACQTGKATFSAQGNTLQDSALIYDIERSLHGPCSPESYFITFKANRIIQQFHTTSPAIIDFKGNYWGDLNGPSICSNPGGYGAVISYYMDYSAWCETEHCDVLNNNYPMLLPAVVIGPCQRPTAGAIAVFIVIFFFVVAINVVMLIVYCMYCNPRKTDSESIHGHYGRMTSLMASIAALSLIVLAFSGIIGSAACPTRVYATKCPFTLTDRAVAGNGLMFGCLMLLVSAATVLLLKFNLQEQRPILYTSMGYQLLSLAISVVIVILSLKNLSSSLRGPYMHLLAVPATGYIVFCILQLYHMEKLRHFCRHTHIALEVSDYRHERARLVGSGASADTDADQKPESSSETETENPASLDAERPDIDEYTFNAVQPIQVFYSDYRRITKRWLIAENSLFGVLLAFAIWYTVASYRAVGAIMITVIVLEYLRILLALYLTKHRGPILGFKVLVSFTGLLKLALLAISIFLYIQVFSLTSHNSAYFTASLLAPTFFFGIVSTIRIWKMFEAIHEKNHG
jgi:hypothetical protein